MTCTNVIDGNTNQLPKDHNQSTMSDKVDKQEQQDTQEAGPTLVGYAMMALKDSANRIGETIQYSLGGNNGDGENAKETKKEAEESSNNQETEKSLGSSWFGGQSNNSEDKSANVQEEDKSQSSGDWIAKKTEEADQAVRETSKICYEKAKDAGEWIGEHVDQANACTREQMDKISHELHDLAEKGWEKAQEMGEYVKDKTGMGGPAASDEKDEKSEKAKDEQEDM